MGEESPCNDHGLGQTHRAVVVCRRAAYRRSFFPVAHAGGPSQGFKDFWKGQVKAGKGQEQ